MPGIFEKARRGLANLIAPKTGQRSFAGAAGGRLYQDWFAAATSVLDPLAAAQPGASPVRVWPHHFDIATLVTLAEGVSVGVGMSPGDGTYDAPYFYVTPWPYPETGALPELSRGARWHTDGWVGAVMPGSALPDTAQREAIVAALDEAYAACAGLLRPR